MKHLQQCRKIFLLVFGILMISGGIMATILALKIEVSPCIKNNTSKELPE